LKFHKFISVVLHPIVIPTIGVLLFLALTPNVIIKERQYLLLSIVFFSTYIVPIIFLVILKSLGVINSFQVESIKERKVPLFLMLLVFYVLGKLLINIPDFKDLGILFYGTNLALIIIYILFFFNIKTSLHIVSMSSALGFFLIYGTLNSISILPIAIIMIVLTGLLASSRLHLKAHKPLEVYLAFFLGVLTQYLGYILL
jgi:hypothetical protein